ncbi:MAG: hypothetical protein L3K15_05735 [Thermoplasmata archaeon]|nr:hypothetical protein [Thermoplasmata archaeon]
MRGSVYFVPSIVLLLAGVTVLLALPVAYNSGQCTCRTGPGPNRTLCPPCPIGRAHNPVGPLLVLFAGLYFMIVLIVRQFRRV